MRDEIDHQPGCGRLVQGGICGCHLCTCQPDADGYVEEHQPECPLHYENGVQYGGRDDG